MTTQSNRVPVGVALLLINSNGQFLLHKRKGLHGGGTWSFPGGAIDRGEEPVQAVYRELQEEAGIVCDVPVRFEQRSWVNTIFENGQQWVTLYFVAAHSGQEPAKVMEPEKNDGWMWTSLQRFPTHLFLPLEQVMGALRDFEQTQAFQDLRQRAKELTREDDNG